MTLFTYKAYLKNGSIDSGVIDSESEEIAFQALSRAGKLPFQVKAAAKGESSRGPEKKPFQFSLFSKLDNKRIFSDISVLLQSGFTIDQALLAISSDAANSAERARCETILGRLKEGTSVAQAFTFEGIPQDVIALISAGESSGNLPTVFHAIASRFEQSEKYKAEAQEALLYPVFLIIMMIAAIFILAFYLVPAIEPIFEGSETGMPFIVSWLSAFRQIMANYGIWIMTIMSLVITAALLSLRFRRWILALRRFLPFIGTFMQEDAIARYLRILHLLLSNGVALKDAMNLAMDTATEGHLMTRLSAAEDDVTAGSSVHDALDKTGILSDGLIAHIRIGEESNNLPMMLGRAATALEVRQKLKLERLLKFLTPAITISLGLLIGLLVTSVMTALLSINEFALR